MKKYMIKLMTSTLDSINTNILSRMSIIDEILNIYFKYEISPDDSQAVGDFLTLITEIHHNYVMATINIIKDYYLAKETNTPSADQNRKQLYTQFIKSFHSINITGDLKRIYTFCKKLERIYKLEDTPHISDLLRKYDCTAVDESYDDRNANMCPTCKIPYEIEEKTSEFTCNCGHVEKMHGVVFEDEQFFYQEGQRTKHGRYDPTKHCRFWVDRIQAKENTEISEKVINAIKKCMRRDQLWIDNVTCESIRGYLKQLRLTTKYNNHVPLIRKLITGKEPPQFTDYELKLIFMYFGLVIQIFNRIKTIDKSNCPYHPYFIYKIVEQILKNPADARRKADILSCIHLQSRDTLIENDRIWELICEYIPEFTFVTTNLRV